MYMVHPCWGVWGDCLEKFVLLHNFRHVHKDRQTCLCTAFQKKSIKSGFIVTEYCAIMNV